MNSLRRPWIQFLTLSLALHGMAQAQDMSPADLETAVHAVNEAQNQAIMASATPQDIERLFELYAPNFVYEHAAYGGTYTREQLKANSLRNFSAGRYKHKEARYQIRRIISGLNAAALERLQVHDGKLHLSVFEFSGGKVVKITEHWR